MKLAYRGQPITCLQDWANYARPKSPDHWRPGRSAYEMAVAWCGEGPRVPDSVKAVFASHPDFRDLRFISGAPEEQIRFDDIGGEPRNADLALIAESPDGLVAITVEGKADEPFGQLVSEALADAVDRGLEARSEGVRRIQQLAAAILPARGDEKRNRPALRKLRYQLLTATAGTLAYARDIGAQHAVLIVHEFVTDATDNARHLGNERDLSLFVQRLTSSKYSSLSEGQLIGPIRIPGSPLFEAPAPLYLGKAVTRLRR